MLKENNGNKFVMFIIVLLVGAILRFWGISYGLLEIFNADEPHIVNLAVSFGSGDLNPHIFKYPTLWPYLLFVSYGSMFVFGYLAGYWHGVEEFGRFFVWHPAPFYLTPMVIYQNLNELFLFKQSPLKYRLGIKSFFSFIFRRSK